MKTGEVEQAFPCEVCDSEREELAAALAALNLTPIDDEAVKAMTPDELLHGLREAVTRHQGGAKTVLTQLFDELDYRMTEMGAYNAPSDWRN